MTFNMDQAQPTGEHRIYAYKCTNSSLGFFSSLFLIILLCSSIRLPQLILLQRRFFGPRYIVLQGRNKKLIISCKEAVRFSFKFFGVIVKLDSNFLFKLKGYFLYFTPIVHSMLKLRIHFRLVLIVYTKCIDSSPYTHVSVQLAFGDARYYTRVPGFSAQALVSFKKYMPPPLPYFKVNICPFLLPHFASIFSLICDPFADLIISLHSRDISLFECHI